MNYICEVEALQWTRKNLEDVRLFCPNIVVYTMSQFEGLEVPCFVHEDGTQEFLSTNDFIVRFPDSSIKVYPEETFNLIFKGAK